jgi:hypothetical protein
MEERKINFKKNDDNTPVLDPGGMLYENLKAMQNKMNEKLSLIIYMLKLRDQRYEKMFIPRNYY